MSHISIRNPGILPILSTNLAIRVAAMASNDRDDRDRVERYGKPPTQAEIAEAGTALPTYEAALKPISDAALVAWAEPINAAVRNPQGPDDFRIRVCAWSYALADVPARCFTPESQREALRTFQFWPAAADVYALLKPQADALKAAAEAVRSIAETSRPSRPEPITQKIRDEVAAKLRLFTADLKSEPLPIGDERPNARYLPREMLNRHYAAAGISGPKVPHETT